MLTYGSLWLVHASALVPLVVVSKTLATRKWRHLGCSGYDLHSCFYLPSLYNSWSKVSSILFLCRHFLLKSEGSHRGCSRLYPFDDSLLFLMMPDSGSIAFLLHWWCRSPWSLSSAQCTGRAGWYCGLVIHDAAWSRNFWKCRGYKLYNYILCEDEWIAIIIFTVPLGYNWSVRFRDGGMDEGVLCRAGIINWIGQRMQFCCCYDPWQKGTF